MSAHELVNPPELARPVGFAHAVVAAPGRTVYLGGQVAHDADGRVVARTIAEHFDVAAGNVMAALRAAGGEAEHLVSLAVYTIAVEEYREALRELGEVHRRHFGRHYPAMALFGVTALLDPEAKLELLGVAVIPA
jgi:enamine deaminase RidA (YjgF/YER057c/UK114 family)